MAGIVSTTELGVSYYEQFHAIRWGDRRDVWAVLGWLS